MTKATEDIAAQLQSLDADLRERQLKDRQKHTERQYKLLQDRVQHLQELLDAVRSIQDVSTFEISPRKPSNSEATAVAVLSDVHIEERVDPSTVNGLNEYTLAIARRRVRAFFSSVARLIEVKRNAIKIDNLVLGLLGDFISNDIHDELMETCQLQPIQAIQLAQEEIASGIEHLLKIKGLRITLPCHSGNHGRTTKKVRHATESGHSLEYFMFHSLASHFKHEKRLTFCIAPGYHSIADVAGFKIRFHHGHNLKYQGGVGGITIPVRKAIAQWNRTGPVDVDCFGHFHQQLWCGNFVCNGSVIGYSPYALAIKAEFEKPRQAFFLVHHRRREMTDFCPVWLEG